MDNLARMLRARASEFARPVSQTGDAMRFFLNYLERPTLLGSMTPSSHALTRAIANLVDPSRPGPVLELGAGTGAVTAALLERGIAPKRLAAVEYLPEFCERLRARFPGVTVIEGDAYDLEHTLPSDGAGPFSAIVSGLPLLYQRPERRRAFIEDALARVVPGGPVVQFSYWPVPTVRGRDGYDVARGALVMANFPPAVVWVYRRTA